MDIVQYLKANPFVLAPMAGITDCAFRTFMRRLGCGVVVTELVSATGLKYNSEKTKKLMQFEEGQHPIGIQLFGEDLEDFAFAAKMVEDMGADFVDLNFGCPVPKVVKKGAGSALLKDLPQFRKVLAATKSAVKIPVTIKVRTGWDESSRNTPEVAQIAYDEGIAWMAIHGRTRAQGYSGLADWEYIREVKAAAKIPILGNGDIVTAQQAVSRLRDSGCDGVLIGRGCLKNPLIFSEAMTLWSQAAPIQMSYKSLFAQMLEDLSRFCDEKIMLIQLKKFAVWYSAGFPASSQFRKEIFQKLDIQSVVDLIDHYFSSVELNSRHDSLEGFLMGGHG